MWISIYLTDDLFLETLNKMKNSLNDNGFIFLKTIYQNLMSIFYKKKLNH